MRYRHGTLVVEVLARENGVVRYYPAGGGFTHTAPEDEFDHHFTPLTAEELRPVFRPGRYGIDDLFEPTLPGFDCGSMWNGWALPHFEFAAAERVALSFGGRYDPTRDSFVTPNEGEDEVWPAVPITVNGLLVKTWPVGAGSWTWDKV